MKKWFLISIALIGLLAACEDWFPTGKRDKPEPPEDPVQKTVIVFDNTNGTCAAAVYSTQYRTDKITEVPAGQISKEFECEPGSSVPFFFSYKLNLIGINALTINYTPEIGFDQDTFPVYADKKNSIAIPVLASTVSSPDKLLSDNSYLIIQNNASFSFSLQSGSTVLKPDNFSDDRVGRGERAYYTIKKTDSKIVSSYLINENGRPSYFSSSLVNLVNFEAGRVYSFIYNGSSISLFSFLDIKLANLATGSLDDPDNKTYVRFTNNNDFTVSVYTNFARNNKIADVSSLSQSGAVQTDPNISGAVFYPNYNIVIEGVTIPYQGELIITRIDADKTADQPNTVTIPLLEHLDDAEFEKPLTNSAYIKIQNDSSSSLSFRQGTGDLLPQGAMSAIVNEGESALYIVSAGNTSNYSFRRNTVTPISFPANVTQFESGKLYSFRFDDVNLTLLAEKPLTLKQAFDLSPPESINARALPSGHIVLSWNRAGTETSYKIYRSVENPDSFTLIGSSEYTSYTDNTVVLGNTYFYKVASVKNNHESEMSVNYVSAVDELFVNHSDYSLRVSNYSNMDLVAFKESIQKTNLIGGIPAHSSNHGLPKNITLFSDRPSHFQVILVTNEQYNLNKNNLDNLNDQIITRIYIFWNGSLDDNKVYEISNRLGGIHKIQYYNSTNYDVEFRTGGIIGPTLAYAPSGMEMTSLYVQSGEYLIYPVFHRLNNITDTLETIILRFPNGEYFSYEINFNSSDVPQTQVINLDDVLVLLE